MAGESKLQSRIRRNLTKEGWEVVKIMLCSRPGFPDQLCLRRNQIVFIEVKDKNKVPEPLQDYWHEKLRKMRFKVFVIDTWDQFLEAKKQF